MSVVGDQSHVKWMSSALVVNFNIFEVQINDTSKWQAGCALEEGEAFTISGIDLLTLILLLFQSTVRKKMAAVYLATIPCKPN